MEEKNADRIPEIQDAELGTVTGGMGTSSYYCCICWCPAYKQSRDGKLYCMSCWQKTPEGQAEGQPIVKPR